jgi:hypothetical protein
MSMRQMAGCINKALNQRGDRYQQSGEKEYWMDDDAEPDSEQPIKSPSLVR